MPTNLQTASDFFDAAKWYYQQARLADAEAMTTRAQELLRLEQPERPAAPPPADPTGVVRVGGSITEPRKLRHVAPIYPAAAQSAGVDGVVILEAIIAKNGSVQDVKVLRSVPLLDEAAIGAVRQWLFSPTLLDKVPVEVIMTVTVNFTR
jgi:protein TonB